MQLHWHSTVSHQCPNHIIRPTNPRRYWEEVLDVANLTASPVFDPITGFGGNGTGSDGCITDGPFVNMTLHLGPVYEITDHCLSRSLNQDAIEWAAQDNIDECMAMQNYSSAWPCFSSKPHTAGHAAVGDVMLDITCSPGGLSSPPSIHRIMLRC